MKDRLRKIIDFYGLTPRGFEKEIFVSEGVISKFLNKKNGIKADTFEKINAIFPDINLDWLITGRGSMLYTEPAEHQSPSSEGVSPSPDALQAIADERERTIQVLQDTNANLLDEIRQLRAYVNITSQKYIAMVEQTLNTAVDTRSVAREIQTQIGFFHDAHIPKASSDHEPH